MNYYQQQQPVRQRGPRYSVALFIATVVVGLAACAGIGLAFVLNYAPPDSLSGGVDGDQVGGGAPTTKPVDRSQITDAGILIVGDDVLPGTYRATVPQDSVACYYARLKDVKGGADSIIANGIGQPGEKVSVTILPEDKAFQAQGCGTWTKIG